MAAESQSLLICDDLCFSYESVESTLLETVAEGVAYEDERYTPSTLALDHLSLELPQHQFIGIIGANGSGKSTFLRHINGLLQAGSGSIRTLGMDPARPEDLPEIRRRCGMIFQNPENQIVGSTVEEDMAFGLENLGLDRQEMHRRMEAVLSELGMADLRDRAVMELSGGQKQKLSIASVLVMHPSCLLMDEVTSMLDPRTRRDLLDTLHELKARHGLSVLHVTHHLSELLDADQVLLFDRGRLTFQGPPAACFASEAFREAGLIAPLEIRAARVAWDFLPPELQEKSPLTPEFSGSEEEREALGKTLALAQAMPELQERLQEQDEIVSTNYREEKSRRTTPITETAGEIATETKTEAEGAGAVCHTSGPASSSDADNELRRGEERQFGPPLVVADGLSFRYQPDLPRTLEDLSFEIREGEIFAIVGPSGAGKSTLAMHLNGLLPKQEGSLRVVGRELDKRSELKSLRREVQLLFQYPEHQLFAETVRKDIAFGPEKLGVPRNEIDYRVREALAWVKLPESMLERSPFELSGGEKRRVALAGILAMRPKLLILDEPAAGLDAQGKEVSFRLMEDLREVGVTIVLISHDMDDVARFADRVLLLRQGRIEALATPSEIYHDTSLLRRCELDTPVLSDFAADLRPYLPALRTDAYSLTGLRDNLRQALLDQTARPVD